MHGNGLLTKFYGTIYNGQFRFGKYCGKGKETKINENYYDGEWLQGKRHGNGL